MATMADQNDGSANDGTSAAWIEPTDGTTGGNEFGDAAVPSILADDGGSSNNVPIPMPTPTPTPQAPPPYVDGNTTGGGMIPSRTKTGGGFGIPIPPDTRNQGGISLKAIGFTCAGGMVVSLLTLLFFGLAVQRRNVNVAPRCTARHPNTIYNPRAGTGRTATANMRRSRREGRWLGWRIVAWLTGGGLFGCGGRGGDKARRAKQARAEARAGTGTGTGTGRLEGADHHTNSHKDGGGAGKGKGGGGAARMGLAKRLALSKSKSSKDTNTDGTSATESGNGNGHHHPNNNGSPIIHTSSDESVETRRAANASAATASVANRSHATDTSSIPSRIKYGGGKDRYAPAPAAVNKSGGKGVDNSGISDLSKSGNNAMMIDDNSLLGNEDDDGDDGKGGDGNYYSGGITSAIQWRGNPFTGWIPWTLALSYDQMLRGVPGTGTRRRGLDGSMLRVNLDAIVLFRFHAICLRVAVLATILCIGIVLPLNLTARCHNITNDPTDPEYDPQCFSADYTLTDYERTTLKNIPPLTYADADDPLKNISDDAGFIERFIAAFKHSAANTIWGSAYRRNLGRLYGIVLCSWIITWYAIRVINREWIDALALRRVYYLENDHWEDRKEELSETLLRDGDSDSDEEDSDDDEVGGTCGCAKKGDTAANRAQQRRRKNKPRSGNKNIGAHHRRDPWIPHPEQRDTVPNVELYSVLVGGLPALPSEVVDEQDIEAAVGYSKRQSIDWQLAVATSFFDHCVPNQPGFSSSIAAITILPDAPELARAWRKWYVAAAALRRLRYIRTLIADLRHYEIHDFDSESESSFENENTVREAIEMKLAEPSSSVGHASRSHRSQPRRAPASSGAAVDISYQTAWQEESTVGGIAPGSATDSDAKAIYLDMQRRMKYYRDVFGSSDNEDVEALLFQALNYGPEQSAVYSREMAQGAAACCPNGCGEERLRRAGIDELLVLERDAIAAVHDANMNLQYAQAKAAVSVLETDDPKMHLPQKGNQAEMDQHIESAGQSSIDAGTAMHSVSTAEQSGHKKSASLEEMTLPEALQMEGQLLAKYQKRASNLQLNRPAAISRHASAPVKSLMGDDLLRTPTTMNHKRAETGVPVAGGFQAVEEGIELGLGDLHSTALPTINEASRSRSANTGTPSKSSFVASSQQQQHPSSVYVSNDPDHPLLRDDPSVLTKGTAGGNSTGTSAISQSSHGGTATTKKLYGRIPHGPSGLATGSDRAMALSADGKFYLREAGSPRGSPTAVMQRSKGPSPVPFGGDGATGNLLDLPASGKNSSVASEWPPATTQGQANSVLNRRRLNTGASQSMRSTSSSRRRTYSGTEEPSVQWAAVERIISDDTTIRDRDSRHQGERYAIGGKHKPTTGVWKMPTASSILKAGWDVFVGIFTGVFRVLWEYVSHKTNAAVNDLARESTCAVVTFTSRQAAVAARHCIADGRGQSRWLTVDEIPVPPLADAAACDFITCRGCCRPVSLSIPKQQQMLRKYFSLLLLAAIYVFYTFPISAAAAFADPSKLYEIWPELEEIVNTSVVFKQILSGIVPALLFTLFFALCPVMFKTIANFGSNATSVAVAEKAALRYYWWFMVCTAFTGSSLMTMVLNAINEGQVANSVTEVLIEIAGTIPTQVSSTWINWIIVRTTMTLPLQYMLQVNTFLFRCIGWKCCARCVVGGGPGGPIPYRIYIDSGVVFLCIVTLAPASPLVAPFALLYFLYCAPLWRRNCLFVYRPKFDSGGSRWPFLSEVFIWSMVVGQILLTTMMALKEAVGPAIFAALPIIPTLLFRKMSRHRFLKSYMDAGLLQTSLLDGWDTAVPTDMEKREEFRQFLVDSHKAAYIPICIAGGASTILTAEPALTMPHEKDANMDLPPVDINAVPNSLDEASLGWAGSTPEIAARVTNQKGAQLRRFGTSYE